MHPRIAEAKQHLEQQRRRVTDAIGSVPEALRDQRGQADRWSPAEVLEHLYIVESGFGKIFAMKVAEARANGLRSDPEDAPIGNDIFRMRMLNREVQFNAPERTVPRGSMSAAQALEKLQESRAAFFEQIDAADGYALQVIRYPHPVLGEQNLYEWLIIAGWHEARHAEQIREIHSIPARD